MGGIVSAGMLMRRSVRIRPTGAMGSWERRFDRADSEGVDEDFRLRYAIKS